MANPVRVRTSAGWQDLALVGPPGPAGAQGPAGPTGPTGPDFAPGTYMLFFQPAAPTGWTKGTAWHNHAIRMSTDASGGGFAGGGVGFTTLFGRTQTDNFTLTASVMGVAPVGILTSGGPASGAVKGTNPWGKDGSWVDQSYYVTGADNNEGLRVGGGAHAHTMDMRLQYVDAISAYKN